MPQPYEYNTKSYLILMIRYFVSYLCHICDTFYLKAVRAQQELDMLRQARISSAYVCLWSVVSSYDLLMHDFTSLSLCFCVCLRQRGLSYALLFFKQKPAANYPKLHYAIMDVLRVFAWSFVMPIEQDVSSISTEVWNVFSLTEARSFYSVITLPWRGGLLPPGNDPCFPNTIAAILKCSQDTSNQLFIEDLSTTDSDDEAATRAASLTTLTRPPRSLSINPPHGCPHPSHMDPRPTGQTEHEVGDPLPVHRSPHVLLAAAPSGTKRKEISSPTPPNDGGRTHRSSDGQIRSGPWAGKPFTLF
eukprot:g54803.t1